jgi:hypothetical protein
MNLTEIIWAGMNWIDLAHDKKQWLPFESNELSGSIKCLEFLE